MGTLNVQGNIIGSASALTNLNYNAITNKPDLSGYAKNTNLNSLSSYSYLNISGTNNYLNSLSSYSYLNINNINATSTLLTTKQKQFNIFKSFFKYIKYSIIKI